MGWSLGSSKELPQGVSGVEGLRVSGSESPAAAATRPMIIYVLHEFYVKKVLSCTKQVSIPEGI